jgi:hypothetical protein
MKFNTMRLMTYVGAVCLSIGALAFLIGDKPILGSVLLLGSFVVGFFNSVEK